MRFIFTICRYKAHSITTAFLCSCFLLFSCLLFAPGVHAQKKVSTTRNKKVFYGQASFYSNKFNGRQTASGEIFSQSKMTCASNILKMGTWVKVTNLRNGKSVNVKVNDRLHPNMKRIVDLTSAAAKKLGFTSAGLTRVKVEVLGNKNPSGKG